MFGHIVCIIIVVPSSYYNVVLDFDDKVGGRQTGTCLDMDGGWGNTRCQIFFVKEVQGGGGGGCEWNEKETNLPTKVTP
jgi:hypothetical protein